MSLELKVGTKLKSAACATEVIVVRSPADPVDVRCGGAPMSAAGTEATTAALDPAHSGGTLLGKRYADPATGIELLCTKAGEGSLSLGHEALPVKDAKPLPSSD